MPIRTPNPVYQLLWPIMAATLLGFVFVGLAAAEDDQVALPEAEVRLESEHPTPKVMKPAVQTAKNEKTAEEGDVAGLVVSPQHQDAGEAPPEEGTQGEEPAGDEGGEPAPSDDPPAEEPPPAPEPDPAPPVEEPPPAPVPPATPAAESAGQSDADDGFGDDGFGDDGFGDDGFGDDGFGDDGFEEDELLGILNFGGSAQLDYLHIPTNTHARDLSLDGFTTELSLKLAADVTDDVSVEVKTCFGCHGFELGAAHVDVRPSEMLRIRAGKFVPRFGDFPQRHDPANHLTSDKPLPYDMGRMVRLREWNMSVLPAPYVDNGAEVNLRHGIGESVELDYAAFVLGGLRGNNGGQDVDFIQSHTPALYYVDNNSQPAVGGRLAAAFFFSRDVVLTMGGSTMWGHYDPERALDYFIVAGDVVLRLWKVTLRAEYLARRTKMDLGLNPSQSMQYGPGEDGEYDPYALKDGFYAEMDTPLFGDVEGIVRVDGLRRQGNVALGSPLRKESAILRYTAGLNYLFAQRTFRVKLSGEFYDFSDFDDEVAMHLGLVGAF